MLAKRHIVRVRRVDLRLLVLVTSSNVMIKLDANILCDVGVCTIPTQCL